MDRILKEIAAEYTERQGEELLREDELINANSVPDFDIPMFKKRKSARRFAFAGAAAAAVILVSITVWRFSALPFSGDNADFSASAGASPAEPITDMSSDATSEDVSTEAVQLSASLPSGSQLLDSKSDNGETVYTIQNYYGNIIVLSVKPFDDNNIFETEDSASITVNDWEGYLLIRRDYKILTVQADGLLYKFTSKFDAEDLYDLATAIL